MTEKEVDGHRAFMAQATRSIFRPRHFSIPAFLCFFLAVGVSFAVLGNLSLESAIPLRISSVLAVDPVPQADLGFGLSSRARTPASFQADAMAQLALILSVIALAAISVAVLNLVILLRNRSEAKAQERAIRLAMGASRKQLALEWILGAGALFGLAGLTGGLVGWLGKHALAWSWPHFLESAQPGGLHSLAPPIFGLLVLSILMASYSVPPDPWSTASPRGILNGGARLVGVRYPEGLKLYLPAFQIGLSITLISGSAFLIGGTFDPSASSGGGLGSPGLLRTPLTLHPVEHRTHRDPEAWDRVVSQVTNLPEISHAALVTPGALTGVGTTDLAWTECGACSIGGMWVPFQAPSVQHHAVSPDSFQTLGVQITQGREFTPSDSPGSPLVAVVNTTYAREFFDEDGPIGRSIGLGEGQESWHTVVGVVEDFGTPGVGSALAPKATVYLSTRQHPPDRAQLIVVPAANRAVDPDALSATIQELDGLVLAGEPSGVGEYLAEAMSSVRWFGWLSTSLGLGTFVIAVFGLYSIMEYSVSLRTEEFAVRRAMGAGPWRILHLVVWKSARVILLGLFLGLEGSLFLASALEGVIAGSPGIDPRLLPGVGAGFLVFGLLGSIKPARRASATPPRVAMGGI